MFHKTTAAAVFAAAGLALATDAGAAGLFRAYLSSTGNDGNPCTLSQPCRLLPAAINAVADGGDIWILDSANYNTGPVSIDRSVTILAVPGALGSIVGNGGDAIDIFTPGVKVTLRNVTIMNIAGSGHGIYMTNGAKLVVDGCLIYGFTSGEGIYIVSTAVLSVVDTVIRGNSDGVRLDGGASATISRSHLIDNGSNGLWLLPMTNVTLSAYVNDSVFNGNTYGIAAQGFNGTSKISIIRSVASGNSLDGFQTSNGGGGSNVTMTLSHSMATNNGRYGITNFAGTIKSDNTNVTSDNASGDANGTITPLTMH